MTASLLPNGKQQFIDINGAPLVGGTVGMYIPNTLIFKNTWQNAEQTVLNTNPIILDSRGQAVIYGIGIYRQIVKDELGNLIWDQLTSSQADNFFVAPEEFGAVGNGSTNDTVAVQSWMDYLVSSGDIGILKSRYAIGAIVIRGSTNIIGTTGSGFNLIGSNAGFSRQSNIDGLYWKDFSVVGSGILADNQYGIIGSSAFTLTNFELTNISCAAVTNGFDLSNAINGTVYGGTVGPTLGDGTSPGTGYGIVIGATTASGLIRIEGVRFYRTARHGLYAGAGSNVTSSNLVFSDHRFGLAAADFAALAYSRGSNFSNSNSLWINSTSAPWSFDNDSTFGAAATTFTITSPTLSGISAAAIVGQAFPGADSTSNHTVSMTGINWEAPNSNVGTAIIVEGCTVGHIDGQFNFANNLSNETNIAIVYIRNTRTVGPYALTIDVHARTYTSNTNNALVEIASSVCASGSDAEIYISPGSYIVSPSGGTAAKILLPDSEVQNSKVIVPGNNGVKAITGATPYISAYGNFNLTQSGATNVTNFLGGYSGQVIAVIAGDANSTFIYSGTIKTLTGGNIVSVANQMYTFKNLANIWYQQ